MAKLDPRADPVSLPPLADEGSSTEDEKGPKEDFSVDRVVVSKAAAKVPASADAPEPEALSSAVVPTNAKKITSQDPRYEAIEKLFDLNDWNKIRDELGAMGDVGKLPPNLGLVAAVAHNEAAKDGDPESIAIAIRCMAGLLGVAEDSPVARVLARRILRKNPVKLRDRQAPAARTSLMIVLLTLVLGGGVGWLASIGSWRGIAHTLHLM